MKFDSVQVHAYSGYRFDDRPLSFFYHEKEYKILEILDRWHEGGQDPQAPHLSYFKVRTIPGEEYILRYNRLFDSWQILIADSP